MPKLTFVIGAAASGKTYFIKQNYEGCCGEITQKVLNGRNVVSACLESDFIEIMTVISDNEIEDSELTEDIL